MSLETEGADALEEWLSKCDLSQFSQQLKTHGISSPDDFKYIESVDQFQELLSSLNNIKFMEKCKLKKAWKSIVPNPEKPPVQIHFLGDKEKIILNILNERFNQLSKDIDYVKKSFNKFNESIVASRKNVNKNADQMILMINNKRKDLLTRIDLIKDKNEKVFNDKLEKLGKMNESIKNSKEQFIKIAANTNITSTERLQQLQKLLATNIDLANDDEKKNNDNNFFNEIGNQCVIPNKIVLAFNKQTFKTHLNSNMIVNCDIIKTEWNLQLRNIDVEKKKNIQKYVAKWSQEHRKNGINLDDNDTKAVATGNNRSIRCQNPIEKGMIVKLKYTIFCDKKNTDITGNCMVVVSSKHKDFKSVSIPFYNGKEMDAYGMDVCKPGLIYQPEKKSGNKWGVNKLETGKEVVWYMLVDFKSFETCCLSFYDSNMKLLAPANKRYSMELPNRKHWYPTMGFWNSNTWCRIETV